MPLGIGFVARMAGAIDHAVAPQKQALEESSEGPVRLDIQQTPDCYLSAKEQ